MCTWTTLNAPFVTWHSAERLMYDDTKKLFIKSSELFLQSWFNSYYYYYFIILLLTAIEFSLGGSSPYTGTDKTNKNKYT